MKVKRIKGKIAAAALLLALLSPCAAAYGQSDGPFSNADGFFNNADGVRDGNGGNGGSWNDVNGGGNGAVWNGLNDATPVGGGLLVLALSGVCYAGAKRMKGKR